MPLSYQGRLLRGRLSGPRAALAVGGQRLDRYTHAHRIDLRLVWDAPDPIEWCARHLPDGFDGFWLDIAAEADPADWETYLDWAQTLRGGRISLSSIARGRGNEVVLDLPGAAPDRIDAERFDPLRQHLHVHRLGVRYRESGARLGMSPERRRLAAGRVRAAFEQLGGRVDGELPEYDALVMDDPRLEPVDPRLLDAHHTPRGRPIFDPPTSRASVPADAVDVRARITDGAPVELHAWLPEEAHAARGALWQQWLTLVERCDLIIVRCMGTRQALTQLLDRFDLHHRHPHRPHQTFGLHTRHLVDPLPRATIDAIADSPIVNEALVEWGVRWSDIQLRLEGRLDQAKVPGRSFFVVRTERERVYDSLHLVLEVDDPSAPAFRHARRQLSAAFTGAVEQATAWQFVGHHVDTPVGRAHALLAQRLGGALAAVVADRAPVATHAPELPGPLSRLWSRLRRRGPREAVELTAAFEAQLEEALPGFRHDRRAHLTDRYFISFSRRTRHGTHLIELRRLHNPGGFRITIGVSTVPIQVSDLDAGTGRAAPGLAVPLEELVPERAHLDWRYVDQASATAAIADAVALLAARAAPFFDLADRHLAESSSEAAPGALDTEGDGPQPPDEAAGARGGHPVFVDSTTDTTLDLDDDDEASPETPNVEVAEDTTDDDAPTG